MPTTAGAPTPPTPSDGDDVTPASTSGKQVAGSHFNRRNFILAAATAAAIPVSAATKAALDAGKTSTEGSVASLSRSGLASAFGTGSATTAASRSAATATGGATSGASSTQAAEEAAYAPEAGALSAAVVGRTPRKAVDLANVFGVVCVTSSRNGVWGEHSLIKSRLQELGVRHIRNRLFTGNKGQVEWLRELGAAGIRLNALMGDPTGKGGTPEALVKLAADQLPGVCSSFEGANEWNLQGGSRWVSTLRDHQTRLYRAAKGNSKTRNIPVLAPALGMRQGYTELGNLTNALDYGNIHLYTGGFPPGYRTNDVLASERAVCGAKPIMVTETGWHNAIHSNATHHWTSEAAAGTYAPRLLLEYFTRNVPRIFIYELIDDEPNASMTNHEAHFGLLRQDFSKKPAFTALSNFMALLDKPNTIAAAPTGQLAYTTTRAPGDLKQVLVRRTDGKFVLFLWRDVSIWDPHTERPVSVKPAEVTLSFGSRSAVSAYRPSSSRTAFSKSSAASGISMAIAGEVVAVEVKPV